jgi:hypothetical protein
VAPRKPIPPPIKCGALARHTGQPCKRWAVPGALRCPNHGGLSHPGGRAAAEELHVARRIEATVTAAVSEAMLAAGWPAEIVEETTGHLPRVRPDEESAPAPITREDEESAISTSLARMAESLVHQFQALAVAQAQAAASSGARPATIEGQVVTPDPEHDPVAEDIARLEARPTPRRMTEAARLRQVQDRALTLHGQAADPEPEPPPAPPAPARPGRRTTRLGSQPDGSVNFR